MLPSSKVPVNEKDRPVIHVVDVSSLLCVKAGTSFLTRLCSNEGQCCRQATTGGNRSYTRRGTGLA